MHSIMHSVYFAWSTTLGKEHKLITQSSLKFTSYSHHRPCRDAFGQSLLITTVLVLAIHEERGDVYLVSLFKGYS